MATADSGWRLAWAAFPDRAQVALTAVGLGEPTAWAHLFDDAEDPELEMLEIVETLNGGSRDGENEEALAYADRYGWRRIGGSDSHIVSHIGRCATEFEDEIRDIDGLVAALKGGVFEAVTPLDVG